jgi:hypothetical protein
MLLSVTNATCVLLLVAGAAGQEPDSRLKLSQILPLQGDTAHVQGIDVEGSRLWVTSVDKERKRGLLFEYALPAGRLVRSVEIHDGIRYHPGGLMADEDSLWIPVAEYKKESSAVIQRRDKRTLALRSQFTISDHIGAVAVTPEGLVGANWDARDFYVWDRNGKQLHKASNPTGIAFQDLKFVNGRLVGSGLKPDKSGAIVWMAWPSMKVEDRIDVGRTDHGVALTHEGMAIRDRRLWLLPEDAPSRLFVFELVGK